MPQNVNNTICTIVNAISLLHFYNWNNSYKDAGFRKIHARKGMSVFDKCFVGDFRKFRLVASYKKKIRLYPKHLKTFKRNLWVYYGKYLFNFIHIGNYFISGYCRCMIKIGIKLLNQHIDIF